MTYEAKTSLAQALALCVEETQAEKDKESIKDDGVIWRTTKSGHTIGLDPKTKQPVKGNPNLAAGARSDSEKTKTKILAKRLGGMQASDNSRVLHRHAKSGEYSSAVSDMMSHAKQHIDPGDEESAKHLKALKDAHAKIKGEEGRLASYGRLGDDSGYNLDKHLRTAGSHAASLSKSMDKWDAGGEGRAKEAEEVARREAEADYAKKKAAAEKVKAAEGEKTAAEKAKAKEASAKVVKNSKGAHGALGSIASISDDDIVKGMAHGKMGVEGGRGRLMLDNHAASLKKHAEEMGDKKTAAEIGKVASAARAAQHELDGEIDDGHGEMDPKKLKPQIDRFKAQAAKLHALAKKMHMKEGLDEASGITRRQRETMRYFDALKTVTDNAREGRITSIGNGIGQVEYKYAKMIGAQPWGDWVSLPYPGQTHKSGVTVDTESSKFWAEYNRLEKRTMESVEHAEPIEEAALSAFAKQLSKEGEWHKIRSGRYRGGIQFKWNGMVYGDIRDLRAEGSTSRDRYYVEDLDEYFENLRDAKKAVLDRVAAQKIKRDWPHGYEDPTKESIEEAVKRGLDKMLPWADDPEFGGTNAI